MSRSVSGSCDEHCIYLKSSLIICALGQGLADYSLIMISKFIYMELYIYILVNAWLVTMSITKLFFDYLYLCSLVAINNT